MIKRWLLYGILMAAYTLHAQNSRTMFYLLSKETQHLNETSNEEQLVLLNSGDVLLNTIGTVKDTMFVIHQKGLYTISGYISVNPGVFGKNVSDYISMRVIVRYSTDNFRTSTVITSQTQNYMYGNLSVAEQIQTPERQILLQKGTQIRWFVQRIEHSTLTLNTHKAYQHIDPPTGMLHTKALRIEKID